MAWLDFLFCAFMGWTGVHKFKEGNVVLGTLYFLTLGLCGVGWIVDTVRYLVIAVKRTEEINRARTKRLEESAELPVIEAPELLELKPSEICHYEQNAACISAQSANIERDGGRSASMGQDIKMTLEPRKTVRINWRRTEELLGRLYVTNQRVIITDGQGTVECPVNKIGQIRLYRNLIALRTDSRTIPLATDEAVYVYQIIASVYRQDISLKLTDITRLHTAVCNR